MKFVGEQAALRSEGQQTPHGGETNEFILNLDRRVIRAARLQTLKAVPGPQSSERS